MLIYVSNSIYYKFLFSIHIHFVILLLHSPADVIQTIQVTINTLRYLSGSQQIDFIDVKIVVIHVPCIS